MTPRAWSTWFCIAWVLSTMASMAFRSTSDSARYSGLGSAGSSTSSDGSAAGLILWTFLRSGIAPLSDPTSPTCRFSVPVPRQKGGDRRPRVVVSPPGPVHDDPGPAPGHGDHLGGAPEVAEIPL